MQALKRDGRLGVRLVMDKLYVGNHLVNQHPHQSNQQRRQDGATGTHLSQAHMGPPQAHPVMHPTAPSFAPTDQHFVPPYHHGR
jgi:hypothetical protein